MSNGITYYRRTAAGVRVSQTAADIFTPWNAPRECWLFLAAHDDDIVAGAGLVLQAALAEGVEVHALITSDGRMGYCRAEQRQTIAQIRRREAEHSFALLGLPPANLHCLPYEDGNLQPHRGRRFAAAGDPTALQGATGLQNAYVFLLRQVRPTRVFVPTISDLHPDHRIANEEMLISLFHAQGSIWPELGSPLEGVPWAYEYATYCDFPEPPQIRVEVPAAMHQQKLRAIAAYASQEQIEAVVEGQRKIGPIEYLRDLDFHFYRPQQYEKLFITGR